MCNIFWRCDPTQAMVSLFLSFLDHKRRHTTVGITPLDEGQARRRDLRLTTQNIHERQTSILTVEFEPAIPAGHRPQTHVLDRPAAGISAIKCDYSNRKYYL